MSDQPKWWWAVVFVGILALFIAKYVETSDWTLATVQVLSLVTLITLMVGAVSILLFFTAKRPMTAMAYTAVGISLLGLLSLLFLQVPLMRLMLFVALAVFAAIVFVVADWLKTR